MHVKTTDIRILQHIRKNARMSITNISRKTGIPVSTIFDRLQQQEKEIVKKFTVLLDFSKLGYTVRAHILLKVDPQARDELKSYLITHLCVNNLFRINNGFDFAVECVFATIQQVEDFVETLELQYRIIDKKIFHIIEDVAREKLLTQDHG